MKRKIVLRTLLGIIVFVVLLLVVTMLFIEPWIEKKIQTALHESNSKYQVEIDKVHVSVFTIGLELKTISIRSKSGGGGKADLNGKITSIKLKGLDLVKAIFKDDIIIDEVAVSNLSAEISLSDDPIKQLISSFNLRIDKIHFNNINLAIKKPSSEKTHSIKNGVLNIYDLQILKEDTLSSGIIKQFDFKAGELLSVSLDSMYTIKAYGIVYSATSTTLMADSFSIRPNYKEYDFVARKKFQTDRIDVGFSKICMYNFSPADCLKSGGLESSYVEIGKMDMNVFRDKRKKTDHSIKPMILNVMYNYPGKINIDSVGLISGNVVYTEHAEKANHPGRISFKEINGRIYRITNDTAFKKEEGYLEVRSNALLMGKGKVVLSLKARLFDPRNTFSLDGTLADMNAEELNPMLERNVFIYATSGRIDKMNFSFTANNTRATGKMTLFYHGLHLAVKNERTDDTTALNERIVSIIANIKVMNSNPLPGEKVRIGNIDLERNPERSFFNYCAQSILSGMKSSIVKSPRVKKRFLII